MRFSANLNSHSLAAFNRALIGVPRPLCLLFSCESAPISPFNFSPPFSMDLSFFLLFARTYRRTYTLVTNKAQRQEAETRGKMDSVQLLFVKPISSKRAEFGTRRQQQDGSYERSGFQLLCVDLSLQSKKGNSSLFRYMYSIHMNTYPILLARFNGIRTDYRESALT